MPSIRSVTVYCSSSQKVSPVYRETAGALGIQLADRNWTLVYGGNCLGCMDALANGARKRGGRVVGITPRLMVDEGIADRQADELIVTESMRERKELLERRGDAAIALPGGLGTLEEVFEYIVGRQLGYHDKPIVLLNIEGYWNPLLAFIEHGANLGFIRAKALKLFHVADTVQETMQYLSAWKPTEPGVLASPDPSAGDGL